MAPLFRAHADICPQGSLSTISRTFKEEIESAEPYLYVVNASGGERLLWADVEGEEVDLARVYEVGGGRLVLFLQFGFWRKETLGWERQVLSAANQDAHQVQYRFIDWLHSTR